MRLIDKIRRYILFNLLQSLLLYKFCLSNQIRCPNVCECIWRNGKITAQCVGANLMTVPTGAANTLQVIDLSRNNFQTLPSKVFQERGLTNLQKIYLTECKLGRIFSDAFIQLTNLIELDLSKNLLTSVPTESLVYISNVRRLILHDNPIRLVRDNSFTGLVNLIHLDLSDCQIDTIERLAFKDLKSLESLKLDGNRLSTLPVDIFSDKMKLSNIGLHRNPWMCDCHLRPTIEWLNKAKLTPSVPPTCSSPSKLNGLMWNSLTLSDYACPPVFKVHETDLKANLGENVSFVCTVKSTPLAKIYWSWESNDEIMMTMTTMTTMTTAPFNNPNVSSIGGGIENGGKFSVSEDSSVGPDLLVSTFTVHSVDQNDARRRYVCTAENQAQSASKNFTLNIISSPLASLSSWSKVEIAGGFIFFLLGFIVALVLVAMCLIRRYRTSDKSSTSGQGSIDDELNTKFNNLNVSGPREITPEPSLKMDNTKVDSNCNSDYNCMDYTPMCPAIDYYPVILQVYNV